MKQKIKGEIMKEILNEILKESEIILEKQIPKTKSQLCNISIHNVEPLKISEFIEQNNIPKDCFFSCENEFGYNYPVLTYKTEIKTNESDIRNFKIERFDSIVWSLLYSKMIISGYKRVGFMSGMLCKKKSIYELYEQKDFETIEKYYSLFFKKEE